MRLLNGHLVGAILLPADTAFDPREPRLGVYLKARERVGNGRERDVGRLGTHCSVHGRCPLIRLRKAGRFR